MLRFSLLAFAALNTHAAHAQSFPLKFIKGKELHELCRSQPDIALGYVMGAFDYSTHLRRWNGNLDEQLCAPQSLSTGNIRDVVCRYTELNPDERHGDGSELIEAAMKKDFPCS